MKNNKRRFLFWIYFCWFLGYFHCNKGKNTTNTIQHNQITELVLKSFFDCNNCNNLSSFLVYKLIVSCSTSLIFPTSSLLQWPTYDARGKYRHFLLLYFYTKARIQGEYKSLYPHSTLTKFKKYYSKHIACTKNTT